MTKAEIAKQKANAELMVLDALQNFEKVTGRRVVSIHFDHEHEATSCSFKSVTFALNDD